MPKPTVRLQPQQPVGAATGSISSAPLKTAAFDEEDDGSSEKILGILAGVVTALAAVLLVIAMFSSDSVPIGVSLDQNNAGWKIPRQHVKPAEDFAKAIVDASNKPSWKSALVPAEIPEYNSAK